MSTNTDQEHASCDEATDVTKTKESENPLEASLSEENKKKLYRFKVFLDKGIIAQWEYDLKLNELLRSNSKTNVKKSSNNDAEQPQEETSEDPSQLSEKDRAALEKLIMFKNKGFITDLELEWKKKELFRKSKPKPPTSKAPPKIQTPSTPILLPEPSPPNTPVSVETPEISVDTPDTSTTNDSPMILVSSLDMDEVLQKIEEEKVKLRLQVNQGTIKEKDFDYESSERRLLERGVLSSAEYALLSDELGLPKESEFRTPKAASRGKSIRHQSKSTGKIREIEPQDPKDYYIMDWRTLKHDTSNEKIEFEEDQRTINCATLGALVEQMTHNINYDIHILHEFFVTFRSFTDASALFQKLSDRFNTPPPPNVTHEEFAVFKEDVLAPIRLRVTSAIKYWVENFYTFDFRGNEDQLRRLDVFIQMVENSNSGSLAKVIKRSIEKVVEDVLEKIMRVPSPMRTPSIRTLRKIPTLKKTPRGPKSILKNYHRKEIARQLALIDFEMFSKIEAKECLNSAWTKESRETMAPNIHAMTQFFNRISAWVGTEVVKVEKLSDRVRAVCKVIKVAKRSYDLHNYNAVFSVMSGLNSSPIHRLRQTWDALPKEYMQIYDELSELMSRDGNFKNLRTALKDGTPPSIPYVGLYLKDLTFIEDGSPKYITRDEVKMINFSKCRQFAAVIRDIQTFQNQRYAFEVFPELRELLLNPTVMTEQEMYDQSLLREARVLDRKSKAIMNRGSSLMNK